MGLGLPEGDQMPYCMAGHLMGTSPSSRAAAAASASMIPGSVSAMHARIARVAAALLARRRLSGEEIDALIRSPEA